MKIWIDDVREPPFGYKWCKTVVDAKALIERCELYSSFVSELWEIEVIDLDYDAGEYAVYGGDYIKLLDWLEETGRNYPIRIHSMNPVGKENMRRIIERNGWREIV